MKRATVQQFGRQIKDLREQRQLSIRGLADAAGLSDSSLVRLEHGEVVNPQPDTLRRLADVFDLPLADLFVMAGYVTPLDLPSLTYYLYAKYDCLPSDALDELEQHVRRLIGDDRALHDNPQRP